MRKCSKTNSVSCYCDQRNGWHISKTTFPNSRNFLNVILWPWLTPPLTTVMYFRFCGLPADLLPLSATNALIRRWRCVGISSYVIVYTMAVNCALRRNLLSTIALRWIRQPSISYERVDTGYFTFQDSWLAISASLIRKIRSICCISTFYPYLLLSSFLTTISSLYDSWLHAWSRT